MSTALIIVNYRTAELCGDCLDSLAAEIAGDADLHVHVLDSASGDGSVAYLREFLQRRGYASWCTLTPLERNGGFAFANNWQLKSTLGSGDRPEFYLLLNPDTIVRPGAVRTLIEFLRAQPQAGIAGARLEDPDGTPQISAFKFPSVPGEFERSARFGPATRLLRRWRIAPPVRDEAHVCDWVAGACMLIRRKVFERIGMLDEQYFMYYEEVDFCRRAARRGWECWYVPTVRIVHLVGQSSGVTDSKRPPRRLPAYWFESRQRYFEKNHGIVCRVMADISWSLGHTIHAICRPLRGTRNTDPPMIFRDFLAHSMRLATQREFSAAGSGPSTAS